MILAHEFDPDRFLDDRLHKYLTPNPFIFLPFNAGLGFALVNRYELVVFAFLLSYH